MNLKKIDGELLRADCNDNCARKKIFALTRDCIKHC